MILQHNVSALNSYRQLRTNNSAISKNLEKLSSGYKINRAGDDAAGLAISEKMRAQIVGLETAQKNANDGISLVQTAEGALTEVHSMLNRMVELATQSANGTYDNETDRANLQEEVKSLKSEIDRISEGTNFNGINLLDGTMGKKIITDPTALTITETTAGATGAKAKYTLDLSGMTATEAGTVQFTIGEKKYEVTLAKGDNAAAIAGKLKTAYDADKITGTATGDFTATVSGNTLVLEATNNAVDDSPLLGLKGKDYSVKSTQPGTINLQIGDTADPFNKINVSIDSMDTESLEIDDVDISSPEGADAAIADLKKAINKVSSTRGELGAIQNRLEHTINNLGVTTENMTAAESRIRDTDMADEMMAYTKNNILVQASQAMLAQANTMPQGILQLLQ